jgi:hypothetical protein
MSTLEPTRPGWSRGRFLLVVAVLFAGQAGWVLLMGERPRPPRLPAAPRLVLRLLDAPLDDEKWTKHVFAGDPTVFPSSSPHGFADQTWRRLRTNDGAPTLPEPPPAFLAFAAKWSGGVLPQAGLESRPPSFQLAEPAEPPPESVPAFPAREASRPESFLRIAGDLAGRQLGPPVALPVWTNNSLVTNSVVRLGVNRAGQVFSAVVQASSGLKEADDAAVAKVYVLRFRPVSGRAPEYAWDTATFYWKTIEPPPK